MSTNKFSKLSKSQAAVVGLKNILLERQNIEKEAELKLYQLQFEYNKKYIAFSEKAKEIIEGKEVNEADCNEFFKILPDDADLTTHVGQIPPFQPADSSALKYYWLTVLKNFPHTKQMVTPEDEPLLGYLTDVKSFQLLPNESVPQYPDYIGPALIIEFHFDANEYFSNKILHKYFKLDFLIDAERPYDFDGLVPVKMERSKIEWFPGKDITIKTIKKTQRSKKTKQVRVINKTERQQSFFNYFCTYEEMLKDNLPTEDVDSQMLLDSFIYTDYDMTSEMASDMISKSVIYYLNEGIEDDYEDSDECDDDIEEIGEDDDDIDVDKHGGYSRGGKHGNQAGVKPGHSHGKGHMSRH